MVENLHYEPWQMLGATVLCVDHRYASDIIQVAQDQGLTVEVANGRKNAE
jgi:hypothetical protein